MWVSWYFFFILHRDDFMFINQGLIQRDEANAIIREGIINKIYNING